jgi:hypothetical protein
METPFKYGVYHQIGHLWENYKNTRGGFFWKKKMWVKKSNFFGDFKSPLES